MIAIEVHSLGLSMATSCPQAYRLMEREQSGVCDFFSCFWHLLYVIIRISGVTSQKPKHSQAFTTVLDFCIVINICATSFMDAHAKDFLPMDFLPF